MSLLKDGVTRDWIDYDVEADSIWILVSGEPQAPVHVRQKAIK